MITHCSGELGSDLPFLPGNIFVFARFEPSVPIGWEQRPTVDDIAGDFH